LEEARRSAQSQYDRQAVQTTRQLEESKVQAQALTTQIRELQTRELTDEERAKVQETWAQQDERAQLDTYRAELVDYHKTVFVDSLVFEYRDFGVTRESLTAVETPEEMELFCEQQKSKALEQKLSEGQTVPAQPTAAQPVTTSPSPAPVPTPPAQPAAQPEPQVPAGASAPSDVGSAGAPATGKTFSTEPNAGAMSDNLKNMHWDTVRVRQG
jgi:hypothetical protein